MTGGFMKFVTAVVVIVGLTLGAWQLNDYWGSFKHKHHSSAQELPPDLPEDQLAGMPSSLQSALNNARERGAIGLREFLTAYGNTISDPRRASIELDYAVLVATSDPSAARRAYAKVKGRIDSGSPVFNRMKQLEKTYGE
jgi:hypothetical protein